MIRHVKSNLKQGKEKESQIKKVNTAEKARNR